MNKRLLSTVGTLLLCCGIGQGAAHAALDPEIQKNFNQLINTKHCADCDLRAVVFNQMDLTGVNLEGANLEGAQFNLANLVGANFRHSNLRNASFGGADASQADFRAATLTGSLWGGAYWVDALFDPGQGPSAISNDPQAQQNIPGLNDPLPDIFAPPAEFLPNLAEAQEATQHLEHNVADLFSAFTPREKYPPHKAPRNVESILVLDMENIPDIGQRGYGFWDAFTLFLQPGSKESPQVEQVDQGPLEIIIDNQGQEPEEKKNPHSKVDLPRMNVLFFPSSLAHQG